MATSTAPADLSMTNVLAPVLPHGMLVSRRRRIDYQSGRALEILGHAIEYLTDEFVQGGALLSADRSQLEAVQLLMSVNRQIYFQCPEVPTLGERLAALIGIR